MLNMNYSYTVRDFYSGRFLTIALISRVVSPEEKENRLYGRDLVIINVEVEKEFKGYCYLQCHFMKKKTLNLCPNC